MEFSTSVVFEGEKRKKKKVKLIVQNASGTQALTLRGKENSSQKKLLFKKYAKDNKHTVFVQITDRNDDQPFQDFSGSSTFFMLICTNTVIRLIGASVAESLSLKESESYFSSLKFRNSYSDPLHHFSKSYLKKYLRKTILQNSYDQNHEDYHCIAPHLRRGRNQRLVMRSRGDGYIRLWGSVRGAW